LHARLVLGTALILPWPALADSLSLSSHVTAVTVYPQAAEITREVAFQADKAGTFDLVIPDLPPDAESQGLHFAGSAGLTIGAFALRTDRVPPATPVDSPAVTAARAGLKSAEAALTQAEAARDSILAKAEAATAQVSFLAAIKIDGASLTPDALLALTGAVGAQVLAARQAAIAARTEAAPATEAVTAAQKARDAAQAALDALTATPEDRAALTLTVDVATPGPVTLAITHFVQDASWVPVYELALDDKAATPGLTLDRGAQVAQDTGEDWTGVALTLSTARPGDQSAPTALYPLLRSIGDPEPPVDERAVADGMAMAPPAEPAPVTTAAPTMTTAGADFQGVAVTYHLAQPVSVATGAEDLRLTLDSLAFPATVLAQAVPSRDATAFVVANWVNTGKEVLLPGDRLTLRDGTLVGGGSLPMLAPGDKTTTGFGALDGVKLKREVPDRSTGDHGVFTTSTEQHETAVLSAENLTDQPWKVRMLDQVPYSEQDDLKIDWSADPKPSETDVEGARGILAWTFDLAPGAKQQVTLTTKLNWPSGKVLQ
jgi:uncharacterized protein (TIGR02231 family)